MALLTSIDFLGTSSCRTDIGNDTASFVLNRSVMVDTGWSCVENLRKAGIDPTEVPYLVITHWHHDHYLSLPSLFFYHLCLKGGLGHLTIIGPDEDSKLVVDLALNFLQLSRFYPDASLPKIVCLKAGDTFQTKEFSLETISSLHAVQGLCYKFNDKKNDIAVGFSGDTAYNENLGKFYTNCDILLHECSLGPVTADRTLNKKYLHSDAIDAAQVAREANVPHLVLLHGTTAKKAECIQAARTVFDNQVTWPERGATYYLSKP